MTPKVLTDAEIMDEALQVLMQHMPPSKVARVLAAWRVGKGDYLATRDELFAGETIDSLVAEMKTREREGTTQSQ